MSYPHSTPTVPGRGSARHRSADAGLLGIPGIAAGGYVLFQFRQKRKALYQWAIISVQVALAWEVPYLRL